MSNQERSQKNYRRTEVIAGILFLVGTFVGLLSISPAVDGSDYLIQAYEDMNQVKIAALFQFIMAVSYIGFVILLFPLLQPRNKYLSIGFIGFRLIAGVFNIFGVIIILVLVTLSKEYVDANAFEVSYFETLGTLLRSGRDIINHIVMILLHCIGGMTLYILLFKTKIVPRWISLWGIIGTIITVVATLLVLFDLIGIITTIYITLSIPLALLEIVFAVWLIFRGFKTSIESKNN